MKKICKVIIFVIKITAIAALVNHHVKILVNTLKGAGDEDELIYDYSFGSVAYTKKGSGPAMLLLHSPVMNASGLEWEPLIGHLSKNYTVYIPDLPGFGRSAHPEISYSSYLYASFINAFISDVIGTSVIVMASGKSADFSVCAGKLAPENFEKFILISPKGFNEVPQKCLFRATAKKLVEVPLYGTFIYNMIWLGFLAKDIMRTLPKLNVPRVMQSSKFAMAALFNGDMDLNIKDAALKSGVPTLIALGNTDSISGISPDIETRLFCDRVGAPHLGLDTNKFMGEIHSWLKK